MGKAGLKDFAYLKLLLGVEGIGPQKIFSVKSRFPDFQQFSEASIHSLAHLNGIGFNLAERLHNSKSKFEKVLDATDTEIRKLQKLNADAVTYWDEEYPYLLKQIYYPPLILYRIGNYIEADKKGIAVVGTRQPSNYGKMMAEKFAAELARNNITIISGMARGIDSIAHDSCLKAGGRTIAVIGSGLDVIYPPENRRLFDRICASGLVFSEYELGTKPDAQNFPRRNRIISGLSLGTLVVETRINGGAIQTAEYALDQGREIFAVPGNINIPQSEGPNILIQKSGAKLVTDCEDVLQELELTSGSRIIEKHEPDITLNLFEEKIYSVLTAEQSHIDEIIAKTGMGIGECLSNLLSLEFKGIVRQFPGKMFARY